MPSPFPGMDPYLETSGSWGDFHATFINYLRNALNDALPDNYDARIEERVTLIESNDELRRSIVPDAIVSVDAERAVSRRAGRAGAALLEPVTVPLIMPEEQRETYIEIFSYPEETLVTVVEVLSPTNKVGQGREQYLLKRDAILRQQVHFVELDLLVGGQRAPTAEPIPQDDYYAFVAHSDRRPLCDVYHWSLRQPLPAIPIPLNPPDDDVIIELQPVFTETFARGRYERRLRQSYRAPPRARLSRADRQWAAELAASMATLPGRHD